MRYSDWEQRVMDQEYSEKMDRHESARRRLLPCRDEIGTGAEVGQRGECLRCGADCGERCLEARQEPTP